MSMTAPAPAARPWRAETLQLDFSHPTIRIAAQKLTQLRSGVPERLVAIHEFVRRLPFGAFADVSHVRASDVLRSRRGDCHSKGVLFVALCRAADIPARLNFVRLRPRFLQGILDQGPDTMAHAIGQVRVDDRWIATDGYVVDPILFSQARRLLRETGADCGWGIVADARPGWDGRSECLQQFRWTDVVHDYGMYDDPCEFYEQLSEEEGAPSWVARLKYSMGAKLVNRRVSQLREARVAVSAEA
jgi:hypothetical protein